jgi:hypothetical protein
MLMNTNRRGKIILQKNTKGTIYYGIEKNFQGF